MRTLQGFVGPTYTAEATVIDAERCVNLYPEARDAGTPKANTWLVGTPGLTYWGTAGNGPHRAAFAQNGRAVVISGPGFYELTADHQALLRGGVVDGLDPGTIVSNGDGGNQLLVVVGGYGYVYNLLTNTLTKISDVGFPQGRAVMCGFLDGYGIVLIRDSALFQISDLEDFTTWDPLDIAEKSQTADWLVSLTVDLDHKILNLHGRDTTERWWDTGAAAFPFEPVPNSITAEGCVAEAATIEHTNATLWLAGTEGRGRPQAMAGIGAASQPVSTHAIDARWATYPRVDDCIAFPYDWHGHRFCVFTFPTASATWVYDLVDQQWHEWLAWDPNEGAWVQHLARTHCAAFGTHLVGSRLDGQIYELRADVFVDGGQPHVVPLDVVEFPSTLRPIRRQRRAPHVASDGQRLTCARLRFDFQVGVGASGGPGPGPQGWNPQAMLRLSRDGGLTYGTERWATLGPLGAYRTRVEYRRNGAWRDGVIELTISDPVQVVLVDAFADLEPEASA